MSDTKKMNLENTIFPNSEKGILQSLTPWQNDEPLSAENWISCGISVILIAESEDDPYVSKIYSR